MSVNNSNSSSHHIGTARSVERAFAVWFCGLPCSGKTTLAAALQQELLRLNVNTYLLDGDVLRKGLTKDLGYTEVDRKENIRRAAEVSKLFVDAGIVTLNCFITPTHELRQLAKTIIGENYFIEVFVKCPVEVCEQRDVKGLYKKARLGELKDFTGVSAIFEEPISADVVIDTSLLTIDQCVNDLVEVVKQSLK